MSNSNDHYERGFRHGQDGIEFHPATNSIADYLDYKHGYEEGQRWHHQPDYDEEWEREHLIDGVGFADPGGRSALRAETPDNPRNLPCPTCKRPNMLTPIDRDRGYQCDICADALESGLDLDY